MKLNSICILTAAAIMTACANANANLLFDVYAGATVGVGAATVFDGGHARTDNAQSYGAILGVDIPLARVELEYNYLNHANAHMQLGMLNGYLKMPTPVIKPYLGVGIGAIFAGKYEFDNHPDVDIKSTTAYQAMLGITFDIPAIPVNIDVEGRALYAHDVFDKYGMSPDVLHYDVRAKMRYVF